MRKLIGVISIILVTFSLACCAKLTGPGNTGGTKENNTVENDSSNKDRLTIDDTKSAADNKFGISDNNYPKIDGSTSTFSIVNEIYRVMYEVKEKVSYPEASSKTVPSYKKLINGEVDMILVPYASSEVLKVAESEGVKLEFHPVAAEALVFITPVENKAENITMEQAGKIYIQYGIKNWSELGGPNRKLIPICRNADSGSQSQMDNLVLEDKEMHPSIKKNYVQLTMEDMLELVAFYHNGGMSGSPTDSYALGYTLYTYLKNMAEVTGIDKRLKMLAFEGVTPSEETIADDTYPLTDGYYAVVRSDLPKGHSARNIIDWLQKDEGKAAIRKLGFIPVQ